MNTVRYRLLVSADKLIADLRENTVEGNAMFYNSPFRTFYVFSSSKKIFLGYVFSKSFDITINTFLKPGFYILEGKVLMDESSHLLEIQTKFSKILAFFYTILFGALSGLGVYFLINKSWASFGFILFFLLLSSLALIVFANYSKKSINQTFNEKMSGLAVKLE